MNKSAQTEGAKQKIALWGVGNWGIRIAGSIQSEYRQRVEIVAVDSDVQSLICSSLVHKITIGKKTVKSRGLRRDAGKVEKAFRESEAKIKSKLADCRALMIVGGLGGGVGSSVIPALCNCARELKIFTVAFVTHPFKFEGKKKNLLFQKAREEIEKGPVGLACFSLDRLVGRIEDDTPHEEVFRHCDRILKEAVECMISYLTASPQRGGDYALLESIFSSPGETVMGIQEAAGPNHLVAAVKGALSALSLNASELGMIKGVLLQLETGGSISFRRLEQAIGAVSGVLSEDVDLLYTIDKSKEKGEKIMVRIMAAGVPEEGENAAAQAIPVTLTADHPPAKQTEINFKRLARGMFANTDPTLFEGEDMDIPTFVRKGVSLE